MFDLDLVLFKILQRVYTYIKMLILGQVEHPHYKFVITNLVTKSLCINYIFIFMKNQILLNLVIY